MSRAPRVVLAGIAAAIAMFVPTTAAQAATQEISINLGSGWVHNSATPLFAVDNFAPGFSQTRTLLIRNDTTDVGHLFLSADNIVENENGCMHSEAVIDTTCGALQGELGHELQFSVYVDPDNDGTFETTPRWTGTLYDLASPIDVLNGIPGGGISALRVNMALPYSSGNETQTDSVGFSFRLTLTGAGTGTSGTSGDSSGSGPSTGPGSPTTPQGPGSVEVKGIKIARHPHSGVLHDITSQLPFTGSATERLVAAALWLLVAGTALSLLAASRRRARITGN